jgi:hypothetical protein
MSGRQRGPPHGVARPPTRPETTKGGRHERYHGWHALCWASAFEDPRFGFRAVVSIRAASRQPHDKDTPTPADIEKLDTGEIMSAVAEFALQRLPVLIGRGGQFSLAPFPVVGPFLTGAYRDAR